MTARCEPPECLRGVDGWHWVDADRPIVVYWHSASDHSSEAWRIYATQYSPEGAHNRGYRYLAPVTPPAEVDALREALAICGASVPIHQITDLQGIIAERQQIARAALKEPTP